MKFLFWLRDECDRILADCRQEDIDLWLATGNTSRSLTCTFIVCAIKARLCPPLEFPHRQTREEPTAVSNNRLDRIRWLLAGEQETLPYGTCEILLLAHQQNRPNLQTDPNQVICRFYVVSGSRARTSRSPRSRRAAGVGVRDELPRLDLVTVTFTRP